MAAQAAGLSNPPPNNVYALVYSTRAAELFFSPASGYQTHITHNGAERGITDAQSLWLDGLDSSIEHRFELRAVPQGEAADTLNSTAAVVTLFTGDFTPPVYRVDSVNISASETASSTLAEVAANTQEPIAPSPPPLSSPSLSATIPALAAACNVTSVSELVSCVDSANNFDVINVRSNLTCSGGNCCPSGNALVHLSGVNQLVIEGNGLSLLRSDGQRQCSLVDIIGGQGITLRNWTLDDDINSQPCQVSDRCPRMVHVRNASSVALDNVTVQNGKGYTIYANQVNGFRFSNSRLINSGVLGLYVGHSNTPSTNVRIENSTFVDNQTNALALLGVVGNDSSVNQVTNNRFIRNHRLGQFQVAPQFGTGFTGGGQVYIAQASGVTFENNLISDGYCSNCFVQNRARSGVTGLELGIPREATVRTVSIKNNTISNHDGFGIHSNSNSQLSSNVVVQGNSLSNNTIGISINGGRSSNNRVSSTRWFQSFEGGNDLHSQFVVDSSCSGAAVRRQCGTQDARHGSCVAEISTTADCSQSPVRLRTNFQTVNVGDTVQAAAWVKGTEAEWCLIFTNGSNTIEERCRHLSDTFPTTVGNLLGTPALSQPVPNGANQVAAELRVTQAGVQIVIDDVKMSGF